MRRSLGVVAVMLWGCGANPSPQPVVLTPPALPPSPSGAISEDKPAHARLLALRAEASEIADAPQVAAEAYSSAIALVPDQPRYYLKLAELYGTLRADREAEAVLSEGVRLCRDAEDERVRMLLQLATLAAMRGDAAAAQSRLAQIEQMGAAASGRSFEVALAYLQVPGSSAANRRRALLRLGAFKASPACSGPDGPLSRDTCGFAESLRQQLSSSDETEEPEAPPAPLPPSSDGPLQLPTPHLTMQPTRSDDAFTVWGTGYFLRSRHHRNEVDGKVISVRGFIVKTNLPDAPACAVHATGIADPEDCRAEIPTFWLADRLGAPLSEAIPVLGFASNYAQIYDAIKHFDAGHDEPIEDSYWGMPIPNPLPARGAEVIVTGFYSTTFAKASSGAVSNPVMGILDHRSTTVIQPALVPATLPGVKRK